MAIRQKTVSANKKKDRSKLIAFGFIAVCIIAFFLPFKYLTVGARGLELKSGMFFKVLDASLWGDGKFIFLPTVSSSFLGLAISASVYLLALGLITTIVLSLLSFKKSKRSACLVKAATFIFTWSFAIYALSVCVATVYLKSVPFALDPTSVLLALLGAILYFVFLHKEYERAAWLLLIQFLISLFAVACLLFAITRDGNAISSISRSAKFLLALSALAAVFSLMVTTLLILKLNKWTAILHLINAVAMTALSFCVAMMYQINNVVYIFFSLSAAVAFFAQSLLCIFNFYVVGKYEDRVFGELLVEKYTRAEKPAPAKEETNAVETVASPATEIPDDPAKDALFEGKEDAFIATLSKEEKYEFADLYILKSKGNMAGIPAYEVGAENKEFFSKIFIYLSKYREKISSPLLAKIYDYSQKD